MTSFPSMRVAIPTAPSTGGVAPSSGTNQGLSEYGFEYGCLLPKAQFLSFDDGGFLSQNRESSGQFARPCDVMCPLVAQQFLDCVALMGDFFELGRLRR